MRAVSGHAPLRVGRDPEARPRQFLRRQRRVIKNGAMSWSRSLTIKLKHSTPVIRAARFVLGLRTRGLEKLVFTATTGRTGTLTLTKVLETVDGCKSLHEPHPIMNHDILKATNAGDNSIADKVYPIKSINIRRAAVGYRYYAEANRLFVKTFLRQVVEEFGDRLVIDHRAPTNVIRIADRLDAGRSRTHGRAVPNPPGADAFRGSEDLFSVAEPANQRRHPSAI